MNTSDSKDAQQNEPQQQGESEKMSVAWLQETISEIETQRSELQDLVSGYEEHEHVDGDSKREQRKHNNRVSAARSRQRTRARMEELEEMVRQLTARHLMLKQTLAALLSERAVGYAAPAGTGEGSRESMPYKKPQN